MRAGAGGDRDGEDSVLPRGEGAGNGGGSRHHGALTLTGNDWVTQPPVAPRVRKVRV